ncbi:MAG: hypothetical protein P1U38_08410 [Aeromicrobium sp.]|mgnify:CR=1 FL=1|uniref:septum site-determining protein Ssd n=1 Tax=Aeromicrobium sp. TaxID=1871063 RepID=UPI0025C6AD80|nr:septum site-determining protein Ssd [Aeromicrobium sp.]MCK5891543.1 hypothetical protein [Aeromicrobium sp.]MDF1704783.1 hypothetical protein [Aeromicrobium sp.]
MDAAVVVAATDVVTREAAARWAAALGAVTEPVGSVAAARRHWAEAPAVVVDAAMARSLADAEVARRPHVLLVDAEVGHDDELWRLAVRLGAALVCRPDAQAQAEALELLAAALEGRAEACVLAVVGAVGGAGASTVAAGLALASARRSWRTVLCDLDPCGGLDLVLGAEVEEGARWDTLDLGGGRLPAGALVEVLPRHRGVSYLTRSRDGSAAVPDARGVVSAARRAADLVVIDVPRHPSALSVLAAAELTLVVVPEDLRGVAAARRLLGAVHESAGTVVAVGRGVPGGLGRAVLATHLPVPVVARTAHRRAVPRSVAAGRGPARTRSSDALAATVLGLVGLGTRP